MAVNASLGKIKLTFSRGEGAVAEDTTSVERSREGRGKAVEGAPFEGFAVNNYFARGCSLHVFS